MISRLDLVSDCLLIFKMFDVFWTPFWGVFWDRYVKKWIIKKRVKKGIEKREHRPGGLRQRRGSAEGGRLRLASLQGALH